MIRIPASIWNQNKALITQLYQDEEWPLKQVIKKVQSENFNPSESQLRSRLKNWRVTKPSRRNRKQPSLQQPNIGNSLQVSTPPADDLLIYSKWRLDLADLKIPLSVLTMYMTVPIKDMETYVCRSIEQRHKEKRINHDKIAQPMNSFMLYRSAYADRTKAWITQHAPQSISSQDIAVAAGISWNNETDEIKQRYKYLARLEKSNHLKAHHHGNTPTGSPALHTTPFSSLEIDSNRWNSNRSAPSEMMDHGLPTDGYLPSSWFTSNLTKPLSGIMLSPLPKYEHGLFAYVDNAGIRRADMDGMQYTSTTLAGLPGAAYHDVLQDHAEPPTTESGQLDPQLLEFFGPSNPDAGSHIYGNPHFSRWQESADNSYVPINDPGPVPYAGALADSREAWTMDAAGEQFDQSLFMCSYLCYSAFS
ncbi:hypothetical protein BDW59DRAFT_167897 [Aspergillus cavernicola]|uniref:HMG box domain-containing protein n=1 Tax=Aspergillus cavernicola TaxID=176166 RepID=A0ABR4H9F2_9EURO